MDIFCDQYCGGVLPVMESPFGDGGLELIQRGTGRILQRIIISRLSGV